MLVKATIVLMVLFGGNTLAIGIIQVAKQHAGAKSVVDNVSDKDDASKKDTPAATEEEDSSSESPAPEAEAETGSDSPVEKTEVPEATKAPEKNTETEPKENAEE